MSSPVEAHCLRTLLDPILRNRPVPVRDASVPAPREPRLLECGAGWVELPAALGRKYPSG